MSRHSNFRWTLDADCEAYGFESFSIFSILGVQSDCSQEQIRKHYKKIAVLVHPDKNKQPGAEEAFKILQRAFELIGEPVNIHFIISGVCISKIKNA